MAGLRQNNIQSHRKAGTRFYSIKNPATFMVYWLVPGSFKYLFAGSRLQLFKLLVPTKTCLHSHRKAGTRFSSLKKTATLRVYLLVLGLFKYLFAGSLLTIFKWLVPGKTCLQSHRKAGIRLSCYDIELSVLLTFTESI